MSAELKTRAGNVALVGRPNVGKSTLLNALLGEKLSIVTPRAQTTRDAVTGILTTDDAQLIFVDTPGLLEPQYALHRSMQEVAIAVLRDADLALLLLDATRPEELPRGESLTELQQKRGALFVVVNKVDAADEAAAAGLESWTARELGVAARRISALTGAGLEPLRSALVEALPVSPFFYPADELAVQPMRFFVAELVRETVFEEYTDEVPYATVVRVEEYREERDPIYIRATVYVERDSQKAIILGRAGAGIKRLGERAREKIESFVGGRVYLDLWVKSLPGWRRKVETLRYLGYRVPEGAGVAEPGRPTEPRSERRPPRSKPGSRKRGPKRPRGEK
ncbi:MAG TPA: GTPase Era [Longimicrobiales bacterium]|nr:GTPase Era [Longimicrobiales bacterium]